jgi:hypothetical protein
LGTSKLTATRRISKLELFNAVYAYPTPIVALAAKIGRGCTFCCFGAFECAGDIFIVGLVHGLGVLLCVRMHFFKQAVRAYFSLLSLASQREMDVCGKTHTHTIKLNK